MKISIGIFAWNEEAVVGSTVASVLAQDLPDQDGVEAVEVLVLANGCSDGTAAAAREAFAGPLPPGVRGEVVEIERPSKENAWNVFVHEASDPTSDVLMFMDGDVVLDGPTVLSRLVTALQAEPELAVAGGRPVKHLARRDRRSLRDRLSLGASKLRALQPGQFAGCLYAVRAPLVRRFELPTVLVGEDSFVAACIKTRLFTAPDDDSMIRMIPDARVTFEAYESLPDIYRNLRRRAIGLTINSMLYDRLWAEAGPEIDGGTLLRRWAAEDPDWGREWVAHRCRVRGWFVVPVPLLTRWWRRLRLAPLRRRFLLLPVALVGSILDLVAGCAANRRVRSGRYRSAWVDTSVRTSGALAEPSGVPGSVP